MTGHRPFKDLTKKFPAKRKMRVAERVAELKEEMMLSEIRRARARSQKDLARALKVNQPAVARLEKRANMQVSNLKHYVEALGGSLEITAKFPNAGKVIITNFKKVRRAASSKSKGA